MEIEDAAKEVADVLNQTEGWEAEALGDMISISVDDWTFDLRVMARPEVIA